MDINEILQFTGQLLQVNRTSLWVFADPTDPFILKCVSSYNLTLDLVTAGDQLPLPFPNYMSLLASEPEGLFLFPNHSELSQEWSSYLSNTGIQSKLDVPILFEGKLLGALFFEENRFERKWNLEIRHFAHAIANYLSTTLHSLAAEPGKSLDFDLRLMIQNSPDGVIVINSENQIIFWNSGAYHVFGYKASQIIGKDIETIIPYKDLSTLSEEITEIEGRHKQGSVFPIQISHIQLVKDKQKFRTLIVRDNTLQKLREIQLVKTLQQAQTDSRSKGFFLAMMSHEFRTPLSSIMGFTEWLLEEIEGELNPAQRASLERIKHSSFNLLNLVNDVLDFAKLEASKMELVYAKVDFVSLVKSGVNELEFFSNKKELELIFESKVPSLEVVLDSNRFRQVVINLVANAIKFTEKGHVKVIVDRVEEEAEIKVVDTGIGLGPEELERIFYPFTQAEQPLSLKQEGVGLGLFISQKIIELHQGRIIAESEKGVGSTFTVRIPLNINEEKTD